MAGADNVQIEGLDRANRRSEILRAKRENALAARLTIAEADIAAAEADIATNTADIATNTAQLGNLPLKIAYGRSSIVFDGSAVGTLNYGTTFGASPTVLVQMVVSTGAQRTVTLSSTPGVSSVTLFSTSNDVAAPGTYTIDWVAIGVPV